MKRRYQLGLDSYDRLFPNQDTLPKGGFGNLIALPLQGGPRKDGNSVFVDENFIPYTDQWQFLSGIRKLSEKEVTQFIANNRVEESHGMDIINSHNEGIEQFEDIGIASAKALVNETAQFEISIVSSDRLYISKEGLTSSVINSLIKLASFSNPDFYKSQAMRLSTYGKPRVISCAEDLPHDIALPRGCIQSVLDFVKRNNSTIKIIDQRFVGITIHTQFNGQLSMLQDTAAKAIIAHDIGILSAATGFGKTVVAANIIARRQVNTLILVHRRELMEQWKEQLDMFLVLPKGSIGIIGGGKDKRTGIVDIAIMQSLNYKGTIKELVGDYGQIIVDECHHVSAFSYEQVLAKVKAKYVFLSLIHI